MWSACQPLSLAISASPLRRRLLQRAADRLILATLLKTPSARQGLTDQRRKPLAEKLIKIDAKVVSHGRYVAFQMAEVAIPKKSLRRHPGRLVAELRPPPDAVPA